MPQGGSPARRSTAAASASPSTQRAAGCRGRRRPVSGRTWQFDGAGRPVGLATAGQSVSFQHDAAGREVGRGFEGRRSAGAALRRRPSTPWAAILGDRGTRAGDRCRRREIRLPSRRRTDRHGRRRRRDVERFDVDVAGRVAGVQAAGWTEGYAYDLAGRVARDAASSEVVGGLTGAPRAYDGSLVTRAGAVSYGYDRQGRMVTRSRKRLSQPPENWQFRYDADDRMVAAVSAGEHWSYSLRRVRPADQQATAGCRRRGARADGVHLGRQPC